jgi:hypothetical protein
MTAQLATTPAPGGGSYTPADMVADLTSGTADVLPFVGAGVGGALVLLFAFMGIRKGFDFFMNLAYERGFERGAYSDPMEDARTARNVADGMK